MSSERDLASDERPSMDEFRDLLLQRRRFLSKDVQALEGEACSERTEATGGVASIHPAEQATDNAEQEVSFARVESQSREIREIDSALERLREGSFGTCLGCRRPMTLERLKAIPYADLCTACQASEEAEGNAP